MKKILSVFVVVLCITSCATHTLYSWGNYDDTSYKYLKDNDEKSQKALLATYENIIEKQTGTRNEVPPGVYADYGFLLIQANQTQKGKEMLQKEIALYPESKVFIDRILKMFEK